MVCGRLLTHLTRDPVHILRGGYERFTALYHFFRTQKIIWMPQVSKEQSIGWLVWDTEEEKETQDMEMEAWRDELGAARESSSVVNL